MNRRRPSRISTMRCAAAATSRLWVTMTIVVRCRSPMSRKSFTTRALASESRLPVGSSASRTRGSISSARASAARCISPPESWCSRCRARCSMPTAASSSAQRLSIFCRGQILQQAGQAHVFLHGQRRQQVEELEDEADFARGADRVRPASSRRWIGSSSR